MHKVSWMANELSKSKTSIYKKTNTLKDVLKPYKKKLNGVIYYTTEGFEIIKNSYSIPIIETEVDDNTPNQIDDKYINLLLSDKDEQIKHLKEQLKEKDKSIEQAMELVKNNQVLLLQSQERVLMLETSSSEEKKSFWSKFKKSQPN